MRHATVVVASVLFASAAAAQTVEQVWANNCAKCHGEKGQGGGAGTRTLLTDELFTQDTDRRFLDNIKNGKPDQGMDPFGATMPDPQVWAMVNYIRELQSQEYRQRVADPKAVNGVYTSQRERFRIETVINGGLEVPWSVEVLPDKRLLVTERAGRLRLNSSDAPGGTLSEPVAGTPEVRNRGQGGLMDVTLHPDFAKNGWIYLAYSDPLRKDNNVLGMTKIVRGHIKETNGTPSWTDQETIFEARPEHYLNTDIHFGCKIVFDPKDSHILYFPIGERGRMEMAQDRTRPNGKVHRVTDDGKIPTDNPFADNAAKGEYGSIWSFGHRNPQGLTFDLDGNLWDTEHGPRGGDELNHVVKGRNYGWPIVSFGINYNGAPFKTPWPEASDDIVMPVYRWMPSIAVCGLDVVHGAAFPGWKGDILAGGLAGQVVDRIRVKDDKVVEREEIIRRMGRVRDVVCAKDGTIYVVLNEPDKVIRLVPVAGGG